MKHVPTGPDVFDNSSTQPPYPSCVTGEGQEVHPGRLGVTDGEDVVMFRKDMKILYKWQEHRQSIIVVLEEERSGILQTSRTRASQLRDSTKFAMHRKSS